jgi:hypothetical protein
MQHAAALAKEQLNLIPLKWRLRPHHGSLGGLGGGSRRDRSGYYHNGEIRARLRNDPNATAIIVPVQENGEPREWLSIRREPVIELGLSCSH